MISVLLTLAAVTAAAIAIHRIAGWKPGTPEPIDGVLTAMNCGTCLPPGRDPYEACSCSEDCRHRFCRWGPPLTGLNDVDEAYLASIERRAL